MITTSTPRGWVKLTGVLDELILTAPPTPISDPNSGVTQVEGSTSPPPQGSPLRQRVVIKDQGIDPSASVRGASFFISPDFLPGEEEFDFSPDPEAQIRNDYIPVISMSWESAPPVEADAWSCTLALRDMPVDPRIYRYLEVELVLTTTQGEDPSEGVQLGIGVVDTISTSHGSDGVVVEMSGRDLSSRLRDTLWTGSKGVKHLDIKGVVLSDVITTILSVSGALGPVGRYTRLDLSRLPQSLDSDVGRILGRSIYTPNEGDSVWDVCTSICAYMGMEFTSVGQTLFIQPPQFFSQDPAGYYIYGGPLGNVESLTLTRNIETSIGIRDVVVRARNAASREILVGRSIPTKSVPSSGVIEYPLPPGGWNQGDVDVLAQLIYAAQTITTLDGGLSTSSIDPPDAEALGLISFIPARTPELRSRDTVYVSTTTWDTNTGEEWLAERFGVRADLGAMGDAYLYAIRRINHTFDIESGYHADMDIMMPLALRGLG
jgi:hypothetical protein